MSAKPLAVMLVAAEASGDDRGAGLMQALKARLGQGVRFVGVGGERMTAEGLASPFDIAELSILGLAEGLLACSIKRTSAGALMGSNLRPNCSCSAVKMETVCSSGDGGVAPGIPEGSTEIPFSTKS